MVKLIYGHALEEFADIHLSLTQFHEIATADGITVTLGKKDGSSFTKVEERTIKQAQIKSLKALDLAVPAASAAAQLR